jgi:hypothetical protein
MALELVDICGAGYTDSPPKINVCFVYSMIWPPKFVKVVIIYSSLQVSATSAHF